MNERDLRVLEYDKILNRLSGFAVSPPGKEKCLALRPENRLEEVSRLLAMTEEADAARAQIGGSPMMYFTDVTGSLKICQAGGMLNMRSLLSVAELYKASRTVRSALVTSREDTPHLTELASRLTTHRELEEEIFNAILSEDEMADRASPELYDIRRHIRQINDRMKEKLSQMTRSPQLAKYLQDTIVTMRNGRYVVPVRAECRQDVPGLVHDQSASGQTLYIEPIALVEAGNDLKQWTAKENQEIERILRAFAEEIAPDADLFINNIRILAELDCVFAKAQMGREMQGVPPKINGEGRVNLIMARHPLIDPQAVVPISLWMGGEFRELVITGPNTGGKTVTLKTVGLLALMAQSGMAIPAAYGSEIAVYDAVYADIGDEQSIEQSLSTFSSHMTNIVSILKNATPQSLVLFDELGAGTDPTEGAALAMAILNRLLGEGVSVLATTHYAELKAFALSTRGVENASVEFDVETLRPTYRLSIGVPGKSNAFEISRKLGLPDDLIREAQQSLSKDQIRFEDVIANAEYHRQIAEKERQLAEQAHLETQRALDEAERVRRETEQKKEEYLRKAREEAKRYLQKAQRDAESIIAELKKSRKGDASLKEHELHNMRSQLQQALDDAKGQAVPAADQAEAPANLKIGETVALRGTETKGSVLTLPDSRGELTIQAGIMKMKVNVNQLVRVKEKQASRAPTRASASLSGREVRLECDVRGMTLEEAITQVDLFLDGAALQGLKNVQIIHGKGTGVLRSGIQNYLKRCPRVKEYRLGHYGEGEDGVTVVTLK